MTKFKATRHALALALALLSAGACHDGSETTESTQRELVTPKASELAEVLPEGSLKAAMMPEISAAELSSLVATIEPLKARNGDLRFSDARLNTPAAAPMLLERLAQGRDDEAGRHALILALPRTQGEYAASALALLKSERSETLRAALVDAMRLAKDHGSALEGLKLGLSDSSALVRSRAAYNIGRRADGLALVDALVATLGDSDDEVRTSAARALGQLGASQAFDAVMPLLQSRSPEARLESVRALSRMDAVRAASLVELGALASDSDERIRTAVSKAQAQAY